ncbi:Putative MO25-like protein [Arachis hypogaea]|nr:Putative MO25-like protein [Arachis hypogaea]
MLAVVSPSSSCSQLKVRVIICSGTESVVSLPDGKPGKSLYTTVRELVENSLDSAESISELPLFVANQKKPADIVGILVGILVTNRSKLLRLLGDLKLDKEDE